MSDAVQKAMAVLDALRFASQGSSARLLAVQTGIPKSTVQRLLQSLEETQMVVQDPQRLTYNLGPRTLMLGMAYKQSLDLGKVAAPILTQLRDETRETVGLSVRVGGGRMFIEEVASESELRFASELGKLYPLWSGAAGRVLMMGLSPQEVDVILNDAGLEMMPVHASFDKDVLLTRLEDTRQNGSARAFNETLDNVSSIAVPVRDGTGTAIAALSLSGPSERLTAERMDDVLSNLKAGASRIGQMLGAVSGMRLSAAK